MTIFLMPLKFTSTLVRFIQFMRPTRCCSLHRSAIVTTTLNEVLELAPRVIKKIGYLNIDYEGLDLEVLKGLDLIRYAPTVITIEAHDDQVSQTMAYLQDRGYVRKEQLHFTHLYVRSSATS